MSGYLSPSIVLKRLEYAEYDYILDFLTRDYGKLTAIAKNAKKSKKRFAGVLELFSCMNAVFTDAASGKGKMSLVKEASLTHPFAGIRADVEKIAYASYWSEIINRWVVPGGFQKNLFPLFFYVLTMLDADLAPRETISLLFQMRFMTLAGMTPGLICCRICHKPLNDIAESRIVFDVAVGGLICATCLSTNPVASSRLLSRATVKQLLWLKDGNLRKAGRIQLNADAMREGLAAMEVFVPFHLAMEIKSLKVLHRIRDWRHNNNAREYHFAS